MSEENKALARRWHQIFEGDLAAADDIVAETCVYHDAPPGLLPGPEGVKEWAIMFRNGFPDLRVTEEIFIAEGDRVVARFVGKGTHQGEFMGVPATGNQITISGINIMRIEEGMIVEHWVNLDAVGLMQQIGAIPGA